MNEASAFPFVEIRGRPRERGGSSGRPAGSRCGPTPRPCVGCWGPKRGCAPCPPGTARTARPGQARRGDRPWPTWRPGPDLPPRLRSVRPAPGGRDPGIAEGAGVAFATALLVNVRAEVAGVRAGSVQVEGCTAFAAGRGATARGDVLIGQNQDQAPEMEAFGVVVRVRPDDGPPVVMATFGGLVGYPGLNGEGVAHVQNALANGAWRHALPHYPPQARPAGAGVRGGLPGRLRPRPAGLLRQLRPGRRPGADRGRRVHAGRLRRAGAGRGPPGARQPLPQRPLPAPGTAAGEPPPIPPPVPPACKPFSARSGARSPCARCSRPCATTRGARRPSAPRAGAADADHRLHHRRAGAGSPARRPGQPCQRDYVTYSVE